MTTTPLKHIVFVPGSSWGHLRPALKTSLRMVEKFPNLFISLFVHDPEIPKGIKYLDAESSTHSHRVKIIGATTSNSEPAPVISLDNLLDLYFYLEKSFELWMIQELQRSVDIPIDGQLVSQPSWIIEDQQNGGVSLACKSIHKLPIVSWWSTTAVSLIVRHGNKESGHGGRVLKTITQRHDHSFANTGEMYLQEVTDRLVSIPGVPIHHEWEIIPQHMPIILSLCALLYGRWTNLIKNVDMVICCATLEMAPISAYALSSAFSKPITPFLIGPSVDLTTSSSHSDSDLAVTKFLDQAYTEKGPHSVVYIAFGTFFFPPPDSVTHLTRILDEITHSGLRFILALSNQSAKIDESWMNAHAQAGNAMFPTWANQTAVLDHPSVHYFLTHGGWNSSTEALVRGVPMIFWPFSTDQPTNAMQIATMHDCGFELLQVRTGAAKSTAYQNGRETEIVGTEDAVGGEIREILRLSKGVRGEHQRRNARLLGQVIIDSLKQGGSGDLDMERLGRTLGLL
ncbi:UDP-glycosyltransferase 74C1 OS=Arabidopsis thaliana GN=UGT74C1 PE=2 SV=1 [Rhizoctonia solani AG-1 IB]|uniref:UDP-glycosyltransferase 74C1 n=1 Tax=Thanatephorus cucumeris (strain AG1-IB / isolate 7/3/14) TaxID=1108050 RepID=A0A0B7G4B5_THACB|nr:UDP-glycosyltransferase 74C1 OS=Arabidopsis thaliana GN=UGT74C1 PE=2 SV=1 [Rhizoctonia solani AG-1 IB]